MTIQPSELNLSILPFVEFSQKESLPNVSAIYFSVADQDEILYIGKTHRLNERWRYHHRLEYLKKLNCTKIAWLEFPIEALVDIECSMIDFYQPPLNGTWMTDPEERRGKPRVKSDLDAELAVVFSKFYGVEVEF